MCADLPSTIAHVVSVLYDDFAFFGVRLLSLAFYDAVAQLLIEAGLLPSPKTPRVAADAMLIWGVQVEGWKCSITQAYTLKIAAQALCDTVSSTRDIESRQSLLGCLEWTVALCRPARHLLRILHNTLTVNTRHAHALTPHTLAHAIAAVFSPHLWDDCFAVHSDSPQVTKRAR